VSWIVVHGDSADVLVGQPVSFDAMVTDPPAGIGFMGAEWDRDKGGRDAWIAWLSSIMSSARATLKPGAHALVWALPRTSHWTARALEDAGFEIRDVVTHHFGSGFPKSKALLKPGSEHWILCRVPGPLMDLEIDAARVGQELRVNAPMGTDSYSGYSLKKGGSTVVGRWPANTIFTHGDDCVFVGRRKVATGTAVNRNRKPGTMNSWMKRKSQSGPDKGYGTDGKETIDAWRCGPGCPVATLDTQSGDRGKSSGGRGGASRFFYVAKPSKVERQLGCELFQNDHFTVKSIALMRYLVRLVTPKGGSVLDPFAGSGTTGLACLYEGIDFVGIEADAHHVEIAEARLTFVERAVQKARR
jgi:hypothetical protein